MDITARGAGVRCREGADYRRTWSNDVTWLDCSEWRCAVVGGLEPMDWS